METNVLKTIIDVQTKGVSKAKSEIATMSATQSRHQKLLQQGAQKVLNSVKTELTHRQKVTVMMSAQAKMSEELNKKLGDTKQKLLGVGMTALFGGMAIKKFAEDALRSVFNTFALVSSETSAFSQATASLAGNWEYMKYTMVDALMQSGLLTGFIDGLINIIEWIANLSDSSKIAFMVIMSSLVLLGGALQVFGQGLLLTNGVVTAFGLSAGVAFGLMIGWIVLIEAAIVALVLIWTSDMSKAEKVMWTIVVVILAIVGAVLLLVGTIALPFVIAIIAVIAVIAIFAVMVRKVGSVKNAFKAFGIFLLKIFAEIGDAIINTIVGAINLIIDGINLAIIAYNKFKKLPLDTGIISRVDYSDAGSKVDAMRDRLLAEVEEDKAAKAEDKALKEETTNIETTAYNIQNMNIDMPQGFTYEDMSKGLADMEMKLKGSTGAE